MELRLQGREQLRRLELHTIEDVLALLRQKPGTIWARVHPRHVQFLEPIQPLPRWAWMHGRYDYRGPTFSAQALVDEMIRRTGRQGSLWPEVRRAEFKDLLEAHTRRIEDPLALFMEGPM
jgi:hypothetical protein